MWAGITLIDVWVVHGPLVDSISFPDITIYLGGLDPNSKSAKADKCHTQGVECRCNVILFHYCLPVKLKKAPQFQVYSKQLSFQ